jgi:hypothetical protein
VVNGGRCGDHERAAVTVPGPRLPLSAGGRAETQKTTA